MFLSMLIISTSGSGKTCEMDRKSKKKSKVKADRSAKNAVYQLMYDFLKREDSACEVAELLRKKTKLVGNFVTVHSVSLHAGLVGLVKNSDGVT